MKLKVKKLHQSAKLPTYATKGAACFDLYAATVDGKFAVPSEVHNGYPVTCGTGLAFEIPAGHVMLIFSRSGHGFKNDTRLANCVGVIDSDYRGEIGVGLVNLGDAPYTVQPGDRIAQLMVVPVVQPTLTVVDTLDETERGAGGFGSTGR